MVLWLGLLAFIAEGAGQFLVRDLRSHKKKKKKNSITKRQAMVQMQASNRHEYNTDQHTK